MEVNRFLPIKKLKDDKQKNLATMGKGEDFIRPMGRDQMDGLNIMSFMLNRVAQKQCNLVPSIL